MVPPGWSVFFGRRRLDFLVADPFDAPAHVDRRHRIAVNGNEIAA